MTGSREAAEEVVQEAFVSTRRNWEQVRIPGAYLRTAVANASRSWLRRQALERRQRSEPAAPAAQQPDELWDALDRLSPRQRVAIVLRYYEDLSDAEIAAALGCRDATVRTTIHRALAALRKEIER
jgi:RNA polymerase sigma factor (sigma-70 family)